MKFHSKQKNECRICGSTKLELYLDLGQHPPSNSFISANEFDEEQKFALAVNLCSECGLSQLSEVVSATDIFDDYVYLSSTSKALINHYQEMVDEILKVVISSKSSLVVDIGCNDGITLNCYPSGNYNLLGIEPSSAGDFAVQAGIQVEKLFFNSEVGEILAKKYGSASVITTTNVFAHVDNIRSYTQGVASFLAEEGVFVIEFPYLVDMIDSLYFDTIYHEHLSYLSLSPLINLFSDYKLRAFDVKKINVGASGPGLRLYVCNEGAHYKTKKSIRELLEFEIKWGLKKIETYKDFESRVKMLKQELMNIIYDLKKNGKKIGAYGAPAKGNTMLNYLGVTEDIIVAVAENNELKIGKYTPGTHLLVIPDEEFMKLDISHALLLSWNYADFFLKNSQFIESGGKFIIPLPSPLICPA